MNVKNNNHDIKTIVAKIFDARVVENVEHIDNNLIGNCPVATTGESFSLRHMLAKEDAWRATVCLRKSLRILRQSQGVLLRR